MRVITEFGTRVRDRRLQLGLSQAELGGPAYSGSYISYIESGQRIPSADAIEYIAKRLGVDIIELGAGPGSTVTADLEITSHMMLADRALHEGDWVSALAQTQRVRDLARAADRLDRVWEAEFLTCRILVESMEFETAAERALALAADVVTAMSPVVKAEALTVAARALRAVGRLEAAVDAASQAVEAAPDVDRKVEALLQLLAARAERNEPTEAWVPVARWLEELNPQLPEGHLKGRVHWNIGNVEYALGNNEAGEAHHTRAAALIHASVDLVLWSRLQRVMAHFRLLQGRTDNVADQLAMAESAIRLSGRTSDLVELWVDEARLLMLEGRIDAARDKVEEALAHESFAVPFPTRAEAKELLGEICLAAGDPAAARSAFRSAAEDYEAIGSATRSASAWRRAATVPDTTA